jgi:hypothetical protein
MSSLPPGVPGSPYGGPPPGPPPGAPGSPFGGPPPRLRVRRGGRGCSGCLALIVVLLVIGFVVHAAFPNVVSSLLQTFAP